MKNQSILFGIIGLIIGVVLTVGLGVVYEKFGNEKKEMVEYKSTETVHPENTMMKANENKNDKTMTQMSSDLRDLTGDSFDKAFIQEMIGHHQGAIDMAQQAKTKAKHDEIKKLSDDIISAQNKEINEMKDWQKSWGYMQ